MEATTEQNVLSVKWSDILIFLLQNWIKDQVAGLFKACNDLDCLMKNINNIFDSDEKIENIFSDIRNTNIDNLKIGISKIDWLEYIIDVSKGYILKKWFYKIYDFENLNWRIIFQALDFQIDWLYWYYDYTSGDIITERNDQRFNSIKGANFKV